MYVWNLALFFSPVNVIKSFMSISDENLKSVTDKCCKSISKTWYENI